MSDEARPGGGTRPGLLGTFRWPVRPGLFLGAIISVIGATVLGAGVGGWWLANRTLVASHENAPAPRMDPGAMHASESQMPDVRGLDRSTAEQVLADSAIPVDAITTHTTPSVARPGVVVEQSPAFGSSVISKVDLGIAVPVAMPSLKGMTQEKAVETLSGYGTGVAITYRYSSGAPVGTVLTATPAVGTRLGQSATIVVATAGSTLPLAQVKTIEGRCRSARGVAINGRDYATALACFAGTKASADTTWLLSNTVDRFTASVGIADDGAPGTTVPYQVLIDGKVTVQGNASFGRASAIDVPVTGAIQLAVRVGPTSTQNVRVMFGDPLVHGADLGIARLAKLR